jgi:hypothetical protein
MRYSPDASIDAVYRLLARLAAPEDPAEVRLDEVMIVADALIACGHHRSWASVWWAYAAVHYDMSDEALERAWGLLAAVDAPTEARAAALMLQAEIKMTQAAYASADPAPAEQHALLEEAASLAPEWPSVRLRLARAAKSDGHDAKAREHASAALALLRQGGSTDDPFDSAISGRNLDQGYVEREVAALDGPGA